MPKGEGIIRKLCPRPMIKIDGQDQIFWRCNNLVEYLNYVFKVRFFFARGSGPYPYLWFLFRPICVQAQFYMVFCEQTEKSSSLRSHTASHAHGFARSQLRVLCTLSVFHLLRILITACFGCCKLPSTGAFLPTCFTCCTH